MYILTHTKSKKCHLYFFTSICSSLIETVKSVTSQVLWRFFPVSLPIWVVAFEIFNVSFHLRKLCLPICCVKIGRRVDLEGWIGRIPNLLQTFCSVASKLLRLKVVRRTAPDFERILGVRTHQFESSFSLDTALQEYRMCWWWWWCL